MVPKPPIDWRRMTPDPHLGSSLVPLPAENSVDDIEVVLVSFILQNENLRCVTAGAGYWATDKMTTKTYGDGPGAFGIEAAEDK